jgi:hypothetical protein
LTVTGCPRARLQKKNQLRDYLRVIASSKAGYELRYFKLDDDRGEAAAE